MMILPLCRRYATPAARGEAGPELALDARRIYRPSPESFPGAPRGCNTRHRSATGGARQTGGRGCARPEKRKGMEDIMSDDLFVSTPTRETLVQAWQMRRLRRRLLRGAVICGAIAVATFILAQLMGAGL